MILPVASSASGSPYRLDDLGWLQFDRVRSLVLEADAGLSDLRWRGDSDAVWFASVTDTVVLRDRSVRLRGPATVAVVWVRENLSVKHRLAQQAATASFTVSIGSIA
jgi:hypothetical protein